MPHGEYALWGIKKYIDGWSSPTTFGSMGDNNPFTSNNTSGGAGTGTSAPGGENYELPKMIEEEADCRCKIPCPDCGGCLMTDVPVGCEPCSCPEAPDKIDFKISSDDERIEAILKAIQNGSCVLDNIFNNFPVSYQSTGNGTWIDMCGQSFLVIISVGRFNDDFAEYGYQTRSSYENFAGCWQPINVGNNGIMRISISCDNNLRNFTNCIF